MSYRTVKDEIRDIHCKLHQIHSHNNTAGWTATG